MVDEELNSGDTEVEAELVSRRNTIARAVSIKKNNLVNKLHGKDDLIENSFSSLVFLQEDALREYHLAFVKDEEDFPKEIDLTDGMLIFLMLSNTLNNLDRKVEKVTGIGEVERPSGEVLNEIISRSRAGTKKTGEKISHVEMLDKIKSLAEDLNLDTSLWEGLFNEIISQQKKGMDLVKSYFVDDTLYSLEEAIEYRAGTVGNYYHLLATCLPPKLQSDFLSEVGMGQLFDDMGDVIEDESVQVNPFVVLLKKYQLMDEYRAGEIDIVSHKGVDEAQNRSYQQDLTYIYAGYGNFARGTVSTVKTKKNN